MTFFSQAMRQAKQETIAKSQSYQLSLRQLPRVQNSFFSRNPTITDQSVDPNKQIDPNNFRPPEQKCSHLSFEAAEVPENAENLRPFFKAAEFPINFKQMKKFVPIQEKQIKYREMDADAAEILKMNELFQELLKFEAENLEMKAEQKITAKSEEIQPVNLKENCNEPDLEDEVQVLSVDRRKDGNTQKIAAKKSKAVINADAYQNDRKPKSCQADRVLLKRKQKTEQLVKEAPVFTQQQHTVRSQAAQNLIKVEPFTYFGQGQPKKELQPVDTQENQQKHQSVSASAVDSDAIQALQSKERQSALQIERIRKQNQNYQTVEAKDISQLLVRSQDNHQKQQQQQRQMTAEAFQRFDRTKAFSQNTQIKQLVRNIPDTEQTKQQQQISYIEDKPNQSSYSQNPIVKNTQITQKHQNQTKIYNYDYEKQQLSYNTTSSDGYKKPKKAEYASKLPPTYEIQEAIYQNNLTFEDQAKFPTVNQIMKAIHPNPHPFEIVYQDAMHSVLGSTILSKISNELQQPAPPLRK